MRYMYLSVVILISFSSVRAQDNHPFPWPEGYRAALSLSFDDARLSNVDVGLDLFGKHDVRVTYYVLPGGVQQRLEKWKQAVQDGHEIGNHTLVHPCSGNFAWSRGKALENYSLAAMRTELVESNRQLMELLDVQPVSFAYSCGQTYVGRGKDTRSYVPLIDELFTSGRGWLDEAANDPWFADFAQLQGIEMDGKDFDAEIRPTLENALKDGSWVVLAGHEIGEGGNQTTRTSMLEDLINYVKKEHPEIWLAPVGEVAKFVREKREAFFEEMASQLLFYSSFDHGSSADLATGDAGLYTGKSYGQPEDGMPGIQIPEVDILASGGRYGGALYFGRKTKEVLYFHAKNNIIDRTGTISFWLSLDPEKDLEPGFCDPVQITDSGYNDGAFWVDFSDKNPRLFRMGVFGDLTKWNPDNIAPDKNPAFNDRLVVATDRPFGRDIWTHVAIVFDQINTSDARALFYVNGKLQGQRTIGESFTWDEEKVRIYLGLNYIGKMDELAIFKKALSGEEINRLYFREQGLSQVLRSIK